MKGETVCTDLIQLTLSGNKEAYSELYNVTIQEVYKTAHFLIEDKTDVDDVVQEVYINYMNRFVSMIARSHFVLG